MTDVQLRSDMTVELVRHSATDADVASAARVSILGDSVETVLARDPKRYAAREAGLIDYLMRSRHGTPFEHNSMTFLIRAPIFVFREFHRHRSGWSYNEESGRYRELQPVFYVPGPERNLVQVGKPGAYTFEPGTAEMHSMTRDTLGASYKASYEAYELLLADGVAREVARMCLPVATYSSMYATCNARSLMHFLRLRTIHADATTPSFPQREIEMVAEAMENQWATLMPVTHEAFNRHGRVSP